VATDIQFMKKAIELAGNALGRTSPNPPVGCVLVKHERVIGSGWHHGAGSAHAEVNAVSTATESISGSTAYVTLEPCNITGRTGPCTKVLIENGVTRVVVGATDPNPKVSGGGLRELQGAGIEVESGILEAECNALIDPFRMWVTHGRPLITLKVATTLDGRIATSTGHSRWITGESARRHVHQMRDRHDAVLVGAGTLRADDPALTTRLEYGEGRDPLRVIVSESLNLPSDAKVFAQDKLSATVVVTPDQSSETKRLVEVPTCRRS
jgi:diaminohydroxyphosphoribosylaminopyrimidine deaminase/5-amino-6-(5-phosphoribosylamino)uracil reductase